jgi:indole-3-glycerol phosphate synthase
VNKNIKIVRKQKLKETKKIKQNFPPDLLKSATRFVSGELRSLQVHVKQAKNFVIIPELKSKLYPDNIYLDNFHPLKFARKFEQMGLDSAMVVSIDKTFLGGDPSWINLAKNNTDLPVIARDFFVDPIQVYQAKSIGADGIFLEEKYTTQENFKSILESVVELGLECYVKTDEAKIDELKKLEGVSAFCLDLNTPLVNHELFHSLRNILKEDSLLFAVMFPKSIDDLKDAEQLGFNGVILNNEFWRQLDIFNTFKQMMQWRDEMTNKDQ